MKIKCKIIIEDKNFLPIKLEYDNVTKIIQMIKDYYKILLIIKK